MARATQSRRLAYETLLELERRGGKADALIRTVCEKHAELEARDLAFYRRLTEGVIERRITLDYVIDQYASRKSARMKLPVLLLMRMGAYQLLYMDGVSDAAAVHESVLLAEEKGLAGLKGFLNAVLRRIAREREALPYPEREAEPLTYLSVRYSMPAWIAGRFLDTYGLERAERLLAAYQSKRALTLRLARTEAAETLPERWAAQGVAAEPSPYLPGVYYLWDVPRIESLAGYAEGLFVIQDVSSILAVAAAGIRPGDTVVDVCAAPGGKSLAAAELAGAEGKVYAFDLSEEKVDRIRENAKRLRLLAGEGACGQIEAAVWDARTCRAELEGTADVVLADLPCSGLGVLGRKSDIRYRVTPEDIGSLQALQREILTAAYRYLKPGGTLLYSSCTVTPEEDEENRAWILRELGLRAVSIEEALPEALRGGTGEEGQIKLLCGEPEGMPLLDGFYIARFRRADG